jgi:uncharacterized protein (TIGR02246 family)
MRLIIGALIGICIFVLNLAAQRSDTTEQNAVRRVEDAVAAATDKNDADALDKLWAPDYVFVNPAGLVLMKADRLQLFRSRRLKLESYSRDEETIRIYDKVAIVIYRSTVKGQRGSQDISRQRRVTTVLEKRHGKWLVISQQSTPIVVATR